MSLITLRGIPTYRVVPARRQGHSFLLVYGVDMRIQGILFICPECKKTLLFKPREDGTMDISQLICVEDGYIMKPVQLNELMIDRILRDTIGEVKNVPES